MLKEKKITKWLNPNSIFKSCYGLISAKNWIRREKERIEKETGRTCKILKNEKEQECLFYSDN